LLSFRRLPCRPGGERQARAVVYRPATLADAEERTLTIAREKGYLEE